MRFVVAVVLLLAAADQVLALSAPSVAAPTMPDPRKTPGDVLTTDPRVICAPGYAQTVRTVSKALRAQVVQSYGIVNLPPGQYQIDHLIPLELGGSRGLRNLWPQSYGTTGVSATVKDRLEARLHKLACEGAISFETARQAIASNWQGAYVRYVGPLPGGVKPVSGSAPAVQVPAMPGRSLSASESVSRGVPKIVAGTGVLMPSTSGLACPPETPVKINEQGLYFVPVDRATYKQVRPVLCVSSAAAAVSAGFVAR